MYMSTSGVSTQSKKMSATYLDSSISYFWRSLKQNFGGTPKNQSEITGKYNIIFALK